MAIGGRGFGWFLGWFELFSYAFWCLCLYKLTATFILTAKSCLWEFDEFWDLQCLRRIFDELMTFMPFERLLGGMSGGSD